MLCFFRARLAPMRPCAAILAILCALVWTEASLSPAAADRLHGIAMHGAPALPKDFSHLPYANPAAPKGGSITLGQIGTFDSLNPLILKGIAANGIREYVYESLLARSLDEPFSLYGLLAEAVEMPDDRRTITFHLNPAARFSDGQPVTAEDVVFSWRLLRERGQPYHRANYGSVAAADALDARTARFTFNDDGNREAPLLIGLMPILPRHKIDPETWERTTFDPPVGSGPYRVASLEPGRHVVFKQDPTWWGRDLAVNRGRFNFGEIRYEYFRDQGSLFEAFKVGDVHIRAEDDAGRWTEGYTFPAVTDGRVRRREIATGLPAGMTGLVMNTRRAIFADQRVRQALIQLFDFEWVNKNLFHGAYARTQSYFERSDLSAFGRPADETERKLLAPHLAKIKPDVLAGTHAQPRTDGSGQSRATLQAAFKLLTEAGYVQDGGRLVNARSREPLSFEMMASTRSEERLFQAYAQNLARIGITARIRFTDSAQRWARMRTFDFDMIQWTWVASLSPGNEQMNRWSVESAATELSLNFAGVRDPAANALIDALLSARERPAFVSAVRALDRFLISGDYVVPLYHAPTQWIAHWSHLDGPRTAPLWGFVIDTWWTKSAP